jgi:Flp pilus assembly protein TadG
MNRTRSRKKRQSGNAILESTLCFIFLVPLLVGSVGIGMSLNRAIQANQVTRSAGHMYARGLNFAQTGNNCCSCGWLRG